MEPSNPPSPNPPSHSSGTPPDFSAIASIAEHVSREVHQNIYGHDRAIHQLLAAFLLGGHVLVEGPPGIAKTFLAKSFSAVMNLHFRRVQFTPDLMPSDITGVSIYDQRSGSFRFSPGPIFTDILLADEINRTPPKTQAALLEAMEEHQVTIDGDRHVLSPLFFVIATQNPIEHEGTFPLPEAQLDRFLFKLSLTYTERDHELSMIDTLSGTGGSRPDPASTLKPIPLGVQELLAAREAIRSVRLSRSAGDYILRIAETTRNHSDVLLGASPRAALSLALAAKANAALQERQYVVPDDIQAVAQNVLAHRLVLRPQLIQESQSGPAVIADVLRRVKVPESVEV